MLDLKLIKPKKEQSPDDEEDSRVNQMLLRQGTEIDAFRKVVNKMTQ